MIREINLYSNISKLLNIHPIEKLLLVLISLTYCSYTKNIYIIICNILLFIILSIIAKNPIKIVKKFIIIGFTFFIFTAIAMIWQRESIHLIVLTMVRVINGALSLSFLSLTTPINQLVALLSKNDILKDIADIIKAMERFIILLEDDFIITFRAMEIRAGFSSIKTAAKDCGKAFGIILRNTFIRWRELNLSLKNRCYNGKFNYSFNFKFKFKRFCLIIIYLLMLIIVNTVT